MDGYPESGALTDLERSIEICKDSLSMMPAPHSSLYVETMSELGVASKAEGEVAEALENVVSISRGERAVLNSAYHTEELLVTHACNLARRYAKKASLTKAPEDLEVSIRAQTQLLKMTSAATENPARGRHLHALAARSLGMGLRIKGQLATGVTGLGLSARLLSEDVAFGSGRRCRPFQDSHQDVGAFRWKICVHA